MEQDGRARLGKAMADQRLRLGMSVRAAAAEAKIDRATWADAEAAKRTLAPYNRAGVERALRWAHGSIDVILAGGAPVTTTTATSISPGNDEKLAAEVERIEGLTNLSPGTRLRMIRSVVRLYEEQAREAPRTA